MRIKIRQISNAGFILLGFLAQPFTFLADTIGTMWYRNLVVSGLLLLFFVLRISTSASSEEFQIDYAFGSGHWMRGVRNWPLWLAITVSAICGILLIVISHVGYQAIETLWPAIDGSVHALYNRVNTSPGQPFVYAFLLIAVLAEELFWRHEVIRLLSIGHRNQLLRKIFGQGCCEERYGTLVPIIVSAILYSITVASSGSVILVVAALFLGTFWGVQHIITGTIWAPATTHLLWNAGLFFLWPIPC